MLASANLAVRFLLELVAIGAVAWWGYHATSNGPARVALAIGAPLALILVWTFVVAPGAENSLSAVQRTIIGTILLEVVAAALGFAGQPRLAGLFALAILANAVLMITLRQ